MTIASLTEKFHLVRLALIVMAGLAIWTTFLLYEPAGVELSEMVIQPDAFMREINAIIMDKLGRPSLKIVAPKLIHYQHNDTTQLQDPQLTLYRKSPNPWYITAKYAKATEGMEKVNFWDDVVIHHAADSNSPATVIKTESLLMHPSQQTAETTDPITMIQPNIVVKAVGMYADMNTGNIKLLSQSKGEYAPN